MRLFLASQDFGDHVDRLREMVGNNKKSLVIFNARDYKTEGDKGLAVQEELFAKNDLEFRALDLRDYFSRKEELRKFIDDYKPGLIVLLGGNTFLLRRALKQSGFDKILRDDIKEDKYVFAGHSAGSIIAGPSLHGFERMDKEKLVMPGYQKEVIWDGLGLTSVRVIPHANSPKYDKAVIKIRRELFDKMGWDYITLNDEDVFIVNGDKEELLK